MKGIKFRIFPTREQRDKIAYTLGCNRFIYNAFLAEKLELEKSEYVDVELSNAVNKMLALKKKERIRQRRRDIIEHYTPKFRK